MPGPDPHDLWIDDDDPACPAVSFQPYFWTGNRGKRQARATAILRRLPLARLGVPVVWRTAARLQTGRCALLSQGGGEPEAQVVAIWSIILRAGILGGRKKDGSGSLLRKWVRVCPTRGPAEGVGHA